MSFRYHSQTVKKETLHTISLVAPHLRRAMSVLDVGSGEGYVAHELAARGVSEVQGVDICDVRRIKELPFCLYDGRHLPFPDGRFDLVMLSFVLHHVPDALKVDLLREALRVTRGTVFILEDTPRTALDRFVSQRHGEAYRKKIDSAAPFGFLSDDEWRWLFRGMGVEPEVERLPRLCRSVLQPFARSAFVLRKPAVPAPAPPRGAGAPTKESGTR
jgi:ubiquinone/menaquinone biosynthesis C-methylase UbiE